MGVDLVVNINNIILKKFPKEFILNTDMTLKYFFRSIEKYLSIVNKVFLVIPDDYACPRWLDLTKVKLVYYHDIATECENFDPNKIELFYYKIKELSDNYLSINTATFLLNKLNIEQFFDLKTNKLKIKAIPEKPQSIDKNRQSIYTQYKNFYSSDIDKPFILVPLEGIKPANKTLWQKFYNSVKTQNEKNVYENIDIYSYYFWGLKNNSVILDTKNLNATVYPVDSMWAGIIKYDLENNLKREYIYLEGAFSIEKKLFSTAEIWIKEGLESRVGSIPCKYELN